MNEKLDNSEHLPSLPPLLERKFLSLGKALRLRSFTESALISILVFSLAAIAFGISDRLSALSDPLRVLFFSVGLGGLFFLGIPRYLLRVRKHRNRRALSQLVKTHYPRFGDYLQGALELRRQNSEKMHFSEELSQAALRQVAHDSENIDFTKALPIDRRKPLLIGILGTTTFIISCFIIAPKQSRNAGSRFLLPLQEISRYTLVRFVQTEKKLIIPRGEPYEFTLALKNPTEFDSVPPATLSLNRSSRTKSEYREGYSFMIPAITAPTKASVQAGDAFLKTTLIPSSRPRLESLNISQTFPDYLQLPPKHYSTAKKQLELVKGSTFQLQLQSQKKLKAITNDQGVTFTTTDHEATSSHLEADIPTQYSLTLTAEDNLTSLTPERIYITPTVDSPSTSTLSGPSKEFILLPHETVDLVVRAKDDYGISQAGLKITQKELTEDAFILPITTGRPDLTISTTHYAFNPEVLKLTPDTYLISTLSSDYYPDRVATESQPITVHLLSLEAHAEYLRKNLTHTLDLLDEHYTEEVALLYENTRIQEAFTKTMAQASLPSRLQEAVSKEEAQNQLLRKHTNTLYALLEDAFRNVRIERSTKRVMAEMHDRLTNLSKNDLPELRSLLESALDSQFSLSVREKQLILALALQEKSLQELKATITLGRELGKVFESATFRHRLQELSRKQLHLSSNLWKTYQDVIGFTPEELDPAKRGANARYRREQDQIQQELKWVEDDLRNYAALSEKDSFTNFAEKIAASPVYDDMFHIGELLDINHRYPATLTATQLAKQLAEWASALSSDSQTGGPAPQTGGEGSGGKPEQEQDGEFILRMMEIVRIQQDLRGKTRALEQMKELQQLGDDEN